MQSLIDFLSFKLFISPYVLIACYYMGAIGIPVASWLLARWLGNQLTPTWDINGLVKKSRSKTKRQPPRILLVGLFSIIFISMEIIWRMLFEFLIAYLQMRSALMDLTMQ